MLVDDVLVYRGSLLPSPFLQQMKDKSKKEGSRQRSTKEEDNQVLDWGVMDKLDLSQSILFTNDANILMREVTQNKFNFPTQYLLKFTFINKLEFKNSYGTR